MLKIAHRLGIGIVGIAVLCCLAYAYMVYEKRKKRKNISPWHNMALYGRCTENSPYDTRINIGTHLYNHQLELPISELPSYEDVEKHSLPSYDEIDHLPPVYAVR